MSICRDDAVAHLHGDDLRKDDATATMPRKRCCGVSSRRWCRGCDAAVHLHGDDTVSAGPFDPSLAQFGCQKAEHCPICCWWLSLTSPPRMSTGGSCRKAPCVCIGGIKDKLGKYLLKGNKKNTIRWTGTELNVALKGEQIPFVYFYLNGRKADFLVLRRSASLSILFQFPSINQWPQQCVKISRKSKCIYLVFYATYNNFIWKTRCQKYCFIFSRWIYILEYKDTNITQCAKWNKVAIGVWIFPSFLCYVFGVWIRRQKVVSCNLVSE